MMRLLFYTLLLGLLASPVLAQDVFACGETADSPSPSIAFDDSSERNVEQFNAQILRYLNTTGSADGLQTAITAANTGELPATGAEIVEADITADDTADVLVHVMISYGSTFAHYLGLFTCSDGAVILLDSIYARRGGGDRPDENPAAIVFVEDMNDNQRPEIAIQAATIEGMKYHASLYIYEWDGTALAQIFSIGPDYGAYTDVRAANLDDNPATLELIVGAYYGYGEEVAMAFIEIIHSRPVNRVYEWQGTTLSLACRYFTDEPTTLFETLHSAETRRACGYYDDALPYYERLFTDDTLQTFAEVWSLPWIIIPETVEDETGYAANLERAYLRAFAGYRIVQLELARANDEAAEGIISQLQSDYRRGVHGYIYVAMANAFWETYQEQPDDACAAADTAFHTAADPRIKYYEDTFGEDIIHYGFYFYSGFSYASDPDNVFDVPEDIDGMLDIPIC